MKIDFREEVLKRKDDLVLDLQKLIKINSELTSFDPNREGMPFGEGPRQALDFMLDLGKKDGFKVENVDGYAGHIELGNQEDFVCMIGHLDVVPAGNDWIYPPYGAEIHDGKLYGRGAEDDKGPTMAAYYAMKILNELDLDLSKRVKLILGTDEESGWRCVDHYFKKYPEQPASGFIPDADFPLIYGEKGITRFDIEGKIRCRRLRSIKAGFRPNMVPDYADVELNGDWVDRILKVDSSLKPKLEGEITKLRIHGKSAHGSTPELGENAVFKLVHLLNELGIENDLLRLINKYFLDDTKGKLLQIDKTSKDMGELSLNLGVLEMKNESYTMVLDIRYPNTTTHKEIYDKVLSKVKEFGGTITNKTVQKLLYNDPESELVQTLMDVYKKHTGDKDAKPMTIGGGTFARAISNVVAFGAHFPGHPSYIHQKNEYYLIDDLILATIIYAEALYRLAK